MLYEKGKFTAKRIIDKIIVKGDSIPDVTLSGVDIVHYELIGKNIVYIKTVEYNAVLDILTELTHGLKSANIELKVKLYNENNVFVDSETKIIKDIKLIGYEQLYDNNLLNEYVFIFAEDKNMDFEITSKKGIDNFLYYKELIEERIGSKGSLKTISDDIYKLRKALETTSRSR